MMWQTKFLWAIGVHPASMPKFRFSFLLALVTLLVILTSCSKQSTKKTAPPTSPMAESIRFELAVYLPKVPNRSAEPLSVVNRVLKNFPDLRLVDEIPSEPEAMLVRARVEKNVKDEYPPPNLRSLRYSGHGLGSDQAVALQNSERALILDFAHPKKYVWTALRDANEIIDQLIKETNGWAWDEETREIFSPESWHDKRVEAWVGNIPDISDEITIHIYDNERSIRAVTLGMLKVGLPEVTMNSQGWSSERQMSDMINIFSQCLAEGKRARETGDFELSLLDIKNSRVRNKHLKQIAGRGVGAACLSLKPGRWEEGDPKNSLIELRADKYPGDDDNAKQESMISSFFGAEDAVSDISHSEELLAASEKARAKLTELKKAFDAGLAPGEFIQVKAPFVKENGGNEWMWVEITKWKGNEIEGTLENDPEQIPDLHSGQRVKVQQKDVFDYIHHFPDKRAEGNTTGEIIEKLNQDNGGTRRIDATLTLPECATD